MPNHADPIYDPRLGRLLAPLPAARMSSDAPLAGDTRQNRLLAALPDDRMAACATES